MTAKAAKPDPSNGAISFFYAIHGLFAPLGLFLILIIWDLSGLWGRREPFWLIVILAAAANFFFFREVFKRRGSSPTGYVLIAVTQTLSTLILLCWSYMPLLDEIWGATMFLFPTTGAFCLACSIQAFRFGWKSVRGKEKGAPLAYAGLLSLPIVVISILALWAWM